MKINKLTLSVAMVLAAQAQAHAADTYFDNFIPVASSVAQHAVSSAAETTNPLVLPANFSQKVIANRTNQNALVSGSNSGSWDMIDTNRTGADANRYLFMPFETGTAGVQRVDLWDTNYNTRTVTIVAPGTQSFVSGDASRWTPWGTYLTAEESWGTGSSRGRLFEVTNPTTAGANGGNFVQRNIIPRISHEGLAFDSAKNLYFIDELNGGSIYKYSSLNPNATNGDDYFAAGQTSVLRVGDGNTDNALGSFNWVALTDANGAGLPGFVAATGAGNPAGTIDARATTDLAAFKGTNYQRPEDIEIKTLADGSEVLIIATTTTDNMHTFNLSTKEVMMFADRNTIDAATGLAVGTAFNNLDNVAIDAAGNIYGIEDESGGFANIWKATDANNDGVAESVSVWATVAVQGSEPTGLFFDLTNPNIAYVNIQHPSSGNDMLVQITAVPEPETYAMMLAGLGLVGFMGRRRKA
jgi:secreted PhoX family phosphatase